MKEYPRVTQDDIHNINMVGGRPIFTQRFSGMNDSANEHVRCIFCPSEYKGTDVDVKARLLLDTAMGDQDYGYYELSKADGVM